MHLTCYKIETVPFKKKISSFIVKKQFFSIILSAFVEAGILLLEEALLNLLSFRKHILELYLCNAGGRLFYSSRGCFLKKTKFKIFSRILFIGTQDVFSRFRIHAHGHKFKCRALHQKIHLYLSLLEALDAAHFCSYYCITK